MNDRDGVERHAAPEAIAAMLIENLAKQRGLINEAQWLADLALRRAKQIRSGVWPKEDSDEPH